MTPIERAARALCKLDGYPENATMEGKPLWRDYLPEACAAIEAILEPDKGMISDGAFQIFAGQRITEQDADRAKAVWKAMIKRLLAGLELAERPSAR